MNRLNKLLVSKNVRPALLIGLVVVLFVLPLIVSEYNLTMVTGILIFSLFCLGTNVLLGYTGLLSFGQAAFYGAGAFACGKILLAYPNMVVGVVGGVVVAGALAAILGWFAIRHTAIYFAMITLAFSMMIWAYAQRWPFLGRYDGLRGIPRAPLEIPHVFSINLMGMVSYYFFVLVVCLIAIFLCYRLTHSPLGLTFRGIRDSESRIALTGLSVKRGRWISFVISGSFCGLAGALIAPLNHTVAPPIFYWDTSMSPIIGCVLGGIYQFSGPIVGGAIYFVMKDIIVRYTINWMLPMGIMTIILVLGFRRGIAGSIEQNLIPWLRARFNKGGYQ